MPAALPLPTGAVPFSTTRLRYVCTQQGIGQGLTGILFNNACGLAFENWVLWTLRIAPNKTPIASGARKRANSGLPASVIPDYVTDLKVIDVPSMKSATIADSSFGEVKAVTGNLTMRKMFESRKIPGARRVSKKELRELSKLPWTLDEALSDDTWEARVLPDGGALHVLRLDGLCNLYPSREALAQLVRETREMEAEVRAGGGRFDPAKELLPPLDDFLRDVDTHAQSLGKVLRIPDEALDRSVESLDLVDRALLRVKIAKRMTPEVFTPVTAYVGEVMRLVCDGRWGKMPVTRKQSFPVFDPADYEPYIAAKGAATRVASAAAEKAYADAKARRVSEHRACMAREDARREAYQAAPCLPAPKPIRYEEVDEPVPGHEHEPILWACDRRTVHPVASVIRSLSERSTYGTLRAAVEGHLAPYLIAKRKAAARGGGA